MPQGLYKKFRPAKGLYTKGVIHEKNFKRGFMHKRLARYTRAKTEDFKKIFILHLQPKRGLYMKGVIHEGLYMMHYCSPRISADKMQPSYGGDAGDFALSFKIFSMITMPLKRGSEIFKKTERHMITNVGH